MWNFHSTDETKINRNFSYFFLINFNLMIVLLICNEKEGKKQEVNFRKKWKTAIFLRFIEKKKKNSSIKWFLYHDNITDCVYIYTIIGTKIKLLFHASNTQTRDYFIISLPREIKSLVHRKRLYHKLWSIKIKSFFSRLKDTIKNSFIISSLRKTR